MAKLDGWALIVVDMQNDFLAKHGYYARRERYRQRVREGRLNADAMIDQLARPSVAPPGGFKPRTASLGLVVRKVRYAISRSKELRMPVAYLRAVYDHKFALRPRFLLENREREDYPCKPDTWGAEFIDPVKELIPPRKTRSREKVVEKHTFNGFFKTDLRRFLREWNVHTVVIAGVETHICVLATAQGASYNQFRAVILKDCVATAREYRAKYALNVFRDGFGATKRIAEIF